MTYAELFDIPQDICYLNSAGNGLLPKTSNQWRFDYQQQFFDARSDLRDQQSVFLTNVKETICKEYGFAKTCLYLTPNFSFAYSTLIDLLPHNCNFLALENEYPSILYPIISRDRHFKTIEVDHEIEHRIYEELKNTQYEVLVLSLVHYITGLKIDFDFIKNLKNDFPDLIIIADGSQYLGTEPFSFEQSGIDAFACSGYKWLCSGFGNGFIGLSKNLKSILETKLADRPRPTTDFWREKSVLHTYFEPGHIDVISHGTLKQSLELFGEIGLKNIQTYIETLCTLAYDKLGERGLLLEDIEKRHIRSPLINVQIDQIHYRKLLEQGIKCYPRGSGIRIGIHLYNQPKDIDKLLTTIDDLR